MAKLKKPKPRRLVPEEKLLVAVEPYRVDCVIRLDHLQGVGAVAFREAKRRRWISAVSVPRGLRYLGKRFRLTKTGKRRRAELLKRQEAEVTELLQWKIQQLGPCGFCGWPAQPMRHPMRGARRWRCSNATCIPEYMSSRLWKAISRLGRAQTKGNR